MRSVLGRRAVLDGVVVTSSSRDGGVGWGCRYSVDGGRSELSAAVLTWVDEADAAEALLRRATAVPVEVRGADDAAMDSTTDEDGCPRHRLVVRAGRQVRSIELMLRSSDRPPARHPPDAGRSLLRLYQLLWA